MTEQKEFTLSREAVLALIAGMKAFYVAEEEKEEKGKDDR